MSVVRQGKAGYRMSTAGAVLGPRYAPDELRARLGISYEFSAEQLQVISAPPEEPLLVVAGAGSGKTELMALRVIWLVTNAHVRPDQVLGLTFTRKAAGELAHRIRLYLGRAKRLLAHDALDRQQGRLALLPLVSQYAQRKAAAEAMDFGDQLRRAAVVARDHAEVGDAERDRYRVVLLDEYQDTSQAQVELLRSLFGAGQPVTAGGGPWPALP